MEIQFKISNLQINMKTFIIFSFVVAYSFSAPQFGFGGIPNFGVNIGGCFGGICQEVAANPLSGGLTHSGCVGNHCGQGNLFGGSDGQGGEATQNCQGGLCEQFNLFSGLFK